MGFFLPFESGTTLGRVAIYALKLNLKGPSTLIESPVKNVTGLTWDRNNDFSASRSLEHCSHRCQTKSQNPDPPSRHHLPFEKPFDKLTVLSQIERLTALRKAEGQRCLPAGGGQAIAS